MSSPSFADHPIIYDSPQKVDHINFPWIGHIPFAFYIVSVHRPEVLVELGVHTGNSYNAFCQAVKTLGLKTQCYGVDTWLGDDHAGWYDENVYKNLQAYQIDHYADFSKLMRLTFNEGLVHFSEGSIDLLHIDGCHRYEDVKGDFEAWLPKMSKRGIVLLHDTEVHQLDFGVYKFWEEISQKYTSLNFIHAFGLGCIFVGEEYDHKLPSFIEKDGNRDRFRKVFSRLGLGLSHQFAEQRKEEELSKAMNQLECKEKESESLMHKIDSLKEINRNLEQKNERLDLLKERIDEQLRSLNEKYIGINEKLNTTKEFCEELRNVLNQMDKKYESALNERVKEIEEKNLEIAVGKDQLRSADQELSKVRAAFQGIRNKEKALEIEIEEVRRSLSFRIGWILTRPFGYVYDFFWKSSN